MRPSRSNAATSRVEQAPATVLVVDDELSLREALTVILRPHGYRTFTCESGAAALELARRQRVDVVLLDVHLRGEPDGMAVLAELRSRYPDTQVIMCSVDRDVPQVVRAIKLGAFDYLAKDFGSLSQAAALVGRALERRDARKATVTERNPVARALELGLVIGESPAMRELVGLVARVAPAPARVLIQGESGTGKEMVAQMLHRWSDRADQPFVAINLAAVPSELAESVLFGHEKGSFTGALRTQLGKFEHANHGTLFLDEIGELPLALQGKLLRALQEREVERIGGAKPIPVDVRLVAATHVDLMAAVRAGRFREDLYYRLNVVPLRVPPLRERREEIPELVRFFVRKFASRDRREPASFTETAMARLIGYDWPGNVRELENLIERMMTLCEHSIFDEDDLPTELDGTAPLLLGDGPTRLQSACESFERNFLFKALNRYDWNKAACARHLGISYATMKNKVAKYAIVSPLPGNGRNPHGRDK